MKMPWVILILIFPIMGVGLVSYTHLDVYKRQEMIMKEYIDAIRSRYDYILIDCMPSLGMMTINALVSSDSVLIPVQAAYLPVKGLQQLNKTILTVKKRLNRKLAIEGILLTMVDFRTNYARDIASRVHTTYGSCLLYTSPKMREETTTQTVDVPDDVDAELLAKVLANPEMKALLASLAKAMK